MSYQQLIMIARKVRIWPELPGDAVLLPAPPALPRPPQASLLVSISFALFSLAIYGTVLLQSPVLKNSQFTSFVFPLVLSSGLLTVSFLGLYVMRFFSVRHQRRELLRLYEQRLQNAEKQLQRQHWQERQALLELYPPLSLPAAPQSTYENLGTTSVLTRNLDNQDGALWARRPGDPDFLVLRIGMSKRTTNFPVRIAQGPYLLLPSAKVSAYVDYLDTLQDTFSMLSAPLTCELAGRGPVALLDTQHGLNHARMLMQQLVAQLAYHHSPQDLRLIILAPQAQDLAWQWAHMLPHTHYHDPQQFTENAEDTLNTVAIGSEAVLEQFPLLSREFARREQLWRDDELEELEQLPHLVIIVDHFHPIDDLDQPSFLQTRESGPSQGLRQRPLLALSPLSRPELTLALHYGPQLHISVLCLCAQRGDIPTTSSTLIDLSSFASTPSKNLSNTTPIPKLSHHSSTLAPEETEAKSAIDESITFPVPEAIIQDLRPNPAPSRSCEQLDACSLTTLHEFARRMQPLRALPTRKPQLRSQVDLRQLFEPPLDLLRYTPQVRWQDPLFRSPSFTGKSFPLLRIPIGMRAGDEIYYLDLLKDGPHGLLTGPNASGKLELLQGLLLTLATLYRPTEINFLLLEHDELLKPFRTLPHTIGALERAPSQALQQRFITLLEAEVSKRRQALREGRAQPRLFIVVDEFPNLAESAPSVLEKLFSLTGLSSEIGIHLLFVAQFPGGTQFRRFRDIVQYRLCLRCSPTESQEVLDRDVAARLPAHIPGRAYLLHADQRLDLFQAARVSLPAYAEANRTSHRQEPTTEKDVTTLVTIPVFGDE